MFHKGSKLTGKKWAKLLNRNISKEDLHIDNKNAKRSEPSLIVGESQIKPHPSEAAAQERQQVSVRVGGGGVRWEQPV